VPLAFKGQPAFKGLQAQLETLGRRAQRVQQERKVLLDRLDRLAHKEQRERKVKSEALALLASVQPARRERKALQARRARQVRLEPLAHHLLLWQAQQ
jgi:hypothetical protein